MILQPSPSFNCLTTNPLEDVVQWLLGKHSDALVVPVPGADNMPCKEGMLRHTLRFYPVDTCTSGLFIAKIMKQPPSS